MNTLANLGRFIQKGSAKPRHDSEYMEGGRRAEENDNPYLSARRTWNDHMRAMAHSRSMWQMMAILCLLLAFGSIGGMIYIGSQSKFIPYVVEVNKLGEAAGVMRADRAQVVDRRVVHASVASFISDLRTITPDTAVQRKAIYRLYAMLSTKDPATNKINTWLRENSPFERAAKETVNVEIISAIPQSEESWQVDWKETVYDHQGNIIIAPVTMRALLTIHIAAPNPDVTEDQIRKNPLGVFVYDINWSRKS